MDGRVVYIGDEVTAAGFRLAGVTARAAKAGDALQVLRETRPVAALILLSARLAQHLPRPELRAVLSGVRPLVVVVPDSGALPPELRIGAQVRLQLGVVEA